MLYQLPDGRTVEISLEDYLDFTDEELRSLIGYTYIGDEINNPSYGSVINKSPKIPNPDDDIPYNKIPLDRIPSEHKLKDQDDTSEEEE